MGVRFRKSVKICKGVKVNFSKSGASLSLGGRGCSMNLSKRGTRATVGIPGTGLSYSVFSSNKVAKPVKKTKIVQQDIKLKMDDAGKVRFFNERGQEIFDESFIRKIKSTPQYKAELLRMNSERMANNNKIIQAAKEENDSFINICKLSAKVDGYEDFQKQKKQIVLKKYEIPQPTQKTAYDILKKEARVNVKVPFWQKPKAKKEYISQRLEQKLVEEISRWQAEKERMETVYITEYQNENAFADSVINGEYKAVCEIFENWINECELPVEMNINYDYIESEKTLMLDVDLPEIEDLPSTYLDQTQTGIIKEKKKTQETLRQEYARCVFGLAIFICSNAFNVSPAIERILISGYTQRRNKVGEISDDYIFSLKFERKMYEGKNLSFVNPVDFCLKAENRCNMTATSLFRTIEPYVQY